MKAKLLSFKPAIDQNGNHRSWTGRNNATFYVFDTVWSNGVTGQRNAKSQSPSWEVGKEYEIQHEEKSANNYTWTQITKMDDPDRSKGGGGGRYKKEMSKEEQKEIMMQVAMIAANSIMNKLAEDYNTIIARFMNWLVQEGFKPNNKAIGVQGVLKIACEYWAQVPTQQVTLEAIIDHANKCLTAVNQARTWRESSPQQRSSPSSEQSMATNQENQPSFQPEHQNQPDPNQSENSIQDGKGPESFLIV